MIEPTVGRIVWFWADERVRAEQPLAATVAHVWSNTRVNLAVCGKDGIYSGYTSVFLWDGEGPRPIGDFCEWMPYQIKQAATRS